MWDIQVHASNAQSHSVNFVTSLQIPLSFHGRTLAYRNVRPWKPPWQPPTCAMSKERIFWVLPKSKGALTTALEGNINDFVFTDKTQMEEWSSLGLFNSIYIDDKGHFDGGSLQLIQSAEDVDALMGSRGARGDIVIMDSVDWKIIPAENLIASFQSTATKLFAMVNTVEEAKAMFGMLQVGVDGCVLRSNDPLQVSQFVSLKREIVENVGRPLDGITTVKITAIRPVGVGERVCIDTCSMLREDEGLMVGSSSRATYLVLSEAAEVPYVPSRPFRVNAGPVHSYCLVPGGKTKYLAELTAGDEVLIVGNGGKTTRTAVVGRAKIETRPLLLIEGEADTSSKEKCTVFVQNAETVRLATVEEDGSSSMKSVTMLSIGNRLVLKTDSMARHIGIAIEEDLLEK